MPDVPIYRVGPQPGEPSKVLEGVMLWRKIGQRGLLIASYKRLKKSMIGP